ncbi:MAG: tRNA-intron lyase [Desulfurococcales archaeon]|nr:tRNA-intron lyase [Desulfurococcales archaeon]
MTGECKGLKVRGVMIGDSVLVVDSRAARTLYACGFYGQPVDVEKPKGADFEGPLRLSPLEALYLADKGVLEVVRSSGEPVSLNELRKVLESNERFSRLYRIYKDLRDKGFIVRSGLKFGADFAVYRIGPGLEHAPFIIHVYDIDFELDPVEIIRAGRLGHSVRKKFVIASVERDGSPVYLQIDWFRP